MWTFLPRRVKIGPPSMIQPPIATALTVFGHDFAHTYSWTLGGRVAVCDLVDIVRRRGVDLILQKCCCFWARVKNWSHAVMSGFSDWFCDSV